MHHVTHLYQFRLQGHLGPSTVAAFPDMTIEHTADGETVLVGLVVDQAALHGILMRIRDLGLPLIEVKRVTVSPDKP